MQIKNPIFNSLKNSAYLTASNKYWNQFAIKISLQKIICAISLLFFANYCTASDSFYCATNHAYINVGMTQDQVIAACGSPTAVKDSSGSVTQQIPMTQLIYTDINKGAVFFYPGINRVYSLFSLPSGSTGNTIEIDVINSQVSVIKINGVSSNALSMCKQGNIQIGDNVNNVYNACGAPDNINQTYVNRSVPRQQKPQVWMYESKNYQPGFTLTFVNGILQSIQN